MSVEAVTKTLLTIVTAGALALVGIAWNTRVSYAEFMHFKDSINSTLAVIKTDLTYIKDNIKEIKKELK